MNNNDYIKMSLELHLFFDRIMKEHCIFLEAGINDFNYKKTSNDFQSAFSNILINSLHIANGNISNDLLNSNTIVTKDTKLAEEKTSHLTGIYIDSTITQNELTLKSGVVIENRNLLNAIHKLNKQTIPLLKNMIDFQQDILKSILSCKIYSTNYQSIIEHFINEAKMYHTILNKVEERKILTPKELIEQEIFWNNIMKDHSLFIRGLMDPNEEETIFTANKFKEEYLRILKNYSTNPSYLTNASLNETLKFRNFNIALENSILNCKIKSIILPLLSDHLLREANHFIRILNSYNTMMV